MYSMCRLNVTIDHLSMTDADIAVNLIFGGGHRRDDFQQHDVRDAGLTAFTSNSGNDGTSIIGNQITLVAGFFEGGIFDTQSALTISGNTISYMQQHRDLRQHRQGNPDYRQQHLLTTAIGINLDTTTITQNIVHDNSNYGINATTGYTTVTGNTVYNNNGVSFEAGILLSGGVANNNVAYGNGWGIYGANTTGSASGNLVYGNVNGGISVDNDTFFTGNVVYGNGVIGTGGYGVVLNLSPFGAGGGSFTNNVVYGNVQGGIDVCGSVGFLIQNNTVYQTTGDALTVTTASFGLTIRDNIFWSTAGAAIDILAAAQPAVTSDYNDLYFTGTGVLGISNGVSYSALARLDQCNRIRCR